MDLGGAKATAIGMSTRFGASFSVFRLAGWVDGEYGVRRTDELPKEAEVAETFAAYTTPEALAQKGCDHKFVDSTRCLKCGVSVKDLDEQRQRTQGSLFGE